MDTPDRTACLVCPDSRVNLASPASPASPDFLARTDPWECPASEERRDFLACLVCPEDPDLMEHLA